MWGEPGPRKPFVGAFWAASENIARSAESTESTANLTMSDQYGLEQSINRHPFPSDEHRIHLSIEFHSIVTASGNVRNRDRNCFWGLWHLSTSPCKTSQLSI